MKVTKRKIWWNPVQAVDLVGYKIYIAPAADGITDSSFSMMVPKDKALDGNGKMFLGVPDEIPAFSFLEDVQYKIGIAAVDDNQGESNSFLLSASFDFVPPPTPSDGGIADW